MAAIKIKRVPEELIKHILMVQNAIKKKKGVKQYSQELTLLHIIKEHKEKIS